MKKFVLLFLFAIVFALSGKAYSGAYILYANEEGNSAVLYQSVYNFGSNIGYFIGVDPSGTNKGKVYIHACISNGKYLFTKQVESKKGEYVYATGNFVKEGIHHISLYAQKSGSGGSGQASINW